MAAAPDRADVGGARRGGVSVLDADRSRIRGEQVIVVLDLERLAVPAADGRPWDGQEPADDGIGERGPAQQCKIVC